MVSNFVKRFQLLLFFLLSLIISWSIWIPQTIRVMDGNQDMAAGSNPVNLLAVWGPALSAIILSRYLSGKVGTRRIFHQLQRWHVKFYWFLLVLLYPAAVWLIARGIDILLGYSHDFSFLPLASYFGPEKSWMVIIAIVLALPNALGEELGWRGFALPRLQSHFNALVASIILGIIWGIWHIPMWMAFGMREFFPMFVDVSILILPAILYTWIYNSTGASLLLIWLFHFSMTITQYFLPSAPTHTVDFVNLGIVILVIFVFGYRHLSTNRIMRTEV